MLERVALRRFRRAAIIGGPGDGETGVASYFPSVCSVDGRYPSSRNTRGVFIRSANRASSRKKRASPSFPERNFGQVQSSFRVEMVLCH